MTGKSDLKPTRANSFHKFSVLINSFWQQLIFVSYYRRVQKFHRILEYKYNYQIKFDVSLNVLNR